MEIEFEIEYHDEKGEYQYLNVVLEGDPEWTDASFDYAGTHCTHGKSGTHKLPLYPSLENEPSWDETLFTPEENKIIAKYIKDKWSEVEQAFCDKLERESNDRD